MLINADVKGLEIVAAAYLSRDPVLIDEIVSGVDIHANNQQRFRLPSRLIAKTFVFRLIYGGSAYAYSVDPEFSIVGYSEKQWQEVIDEYYLKYKGMAKWHNFLMKEAVSNGRLVMPTGRIYTFSPEKKNNDIVWPRTTILNYPVQGLGADLVCIARVSVFKRLKALAKSLLISSVHDSIVVDSPLNEVEQACKILKESVEDVPINFERLFKVKFDLPLSVEIQIGEDLKNVVDVPVFSCYNI
jgi:DNA polymerase-1